MTTASLLVELLTEELPPKSLKKLGESFAEILTASLKSQGLIADNATITPYASPRRLGVHVTNVAKQASDKPISQKLMPVAVGLDANGQPTAPLLKKLAALGADASVVPQLKRIQAGKSEALFYDSIKTGITLTEGLKNALEEAITKLPIAKVMNYQLEDGWNSVNFVRPVHGLVALHGTDKIDVSTLGLNADRITQGHRFESKKLIISINEADSYAQQLENEGAVIASFSARRTEILKQITAAAAKQALTPIEDEALLDEVTSLVERPNVLLGVFDPEFLKVPQECLVLTMKSNQKYFPLLDKRNQLTNKFLIVSNIRPEDPSLVIDGNERVVRPRLADAKFFFEQDQKQSLESRVEKLSSVVYHNKLGTQLQRVERIAKLAGTIAHLLNANKSDAERAARLSKADLLTDMVSEFPELQGIMGRYYALHDGENLAVADAIEAHYHPRFAGDELPNGDVSCALALADKLETLLGIYGIGQVPTGDKDPFGLRRHALGILRILIEKPLDLPLRALLQQAKNNFPSEMLSESVVSDVEAFMLDRLRGYLRDQDFESTHIEAVLHTLNGRLHEAIPRLQGVRMFATLAAAKELAAANKRVQNIMRKNSEELGVDLQATSITTKLFEEDAERDLYQAIQDIKPYAQEYLSKGDFGGNLKVLVTLKPFIDDFFEKVMVMCNDKAVRLNRAALLQQLGTLMNQVADISKLAT